jgi:hypothetical protein
MRLEFKLISYLIQILYHTLLLNSKVSVCTIALLAQVLTPLLSMLVSNLPISISPDKIQIRVDTIQIEAKNIVAEVVEDT